MPQYLTIEQDATVPPPVSLPQFKTHDFSRRYEAAAILTEHDIEARAMATRKMQTNPKYKDLHYGEAQYFVTWEDLVRQNIQELIRKKGAPKHTYDGATGLPITTIFNH